MSLTKDRQKSSMPWLIIGLVLYLSFPLLAVTQYGAPPIWILSNLLFALGIFLWCTGGPSGKTLSGSLLYRVLPAILCVTWMQLTAMLAAAWFSRAGGFDDAFFFHFNWQAALTSFKVYPLQSAFASLTLLLSFLWPFFLSPRHSKKGRSRTTAVIFLALALLTFSPLHSLLSYQSEQAQIEPEASTSEDIGSEPSPGPTPPGEEEAEVEPASAGKNIVLVYVEGLENTFFDENVFGELLPQLSAMSPQALRFSNIRQRKGTGWTIAGIVASQCGFPILTAHNQANNSTMASVKKPFADQQCFADILRQLDYQTVFIGGADLRFAGKGNFLRTHGFETTYGRRELANELKDTAPRNEWGYFDDQILDFALRKVKDLDAGEQPWLLTLLTVDTHFPKGTPSPSCTPYLASDDPMSQAIYCTDQLLAEFIEKLWTLTDRENTTLVLFSDHLAFRTTLERKVKSVENRTLTFWIFDSDITAGKNDTPGSHYDVAPSVLDAAQVRTSARLGNGRSLFAAGNQERALERRQKGKRDAAPELLTGATSVAEAGLAFTAQDRSISVGELTLMPNRWGLAFKTGMFLVLFDDEGFVQDTLYETGFQRLQENHSGKFVAGVLQRQENQEPVAFYGRISTNSPNGLRRLPLVNDLIIPPAEIQALLEAQ